MNTYINYDLHISQMGGDYLLRADCSLAGQETGRCIIPFSDEEIQGFLWQDMAFNPRDARPKEIGRRLYDAIFQHNIGNHLRTCLSTAKAQRANLRIRLHLDESSQLTRLPWEYLYDTARDDFFALSIQTPIVRYVDLPIAESSMQVEDPLHILVMIADPVDLQPRLDVDREWIQLRSAFQDLEDAQKIKLHRLPSANRRELQRYLRGNRIDIFHFIGHGHFDELDGEGQLAFEDNQRQTELVSADVLARLLRDEMPSLVYLNSCDTAQTGSYDPLTGTAQKLVQHGIPAVVAMQTAIQDDKAIQIAHEFYLALTDGYPVDAALVEGRKAVFNNNGLSQWGTPVLFMRAPDGILWDHGETDVDNNLLDVSLPPPVRRAHSIPPNLAEKNKMNKRYIQIIGACLLGLIALLIALYPNFMPSAILTPPTPIPPTPTTFSIPTSASIPAGVAASISTATSMATVADTATVIPTVTATPMPGAFSCTNVSDIPLIECEALVALYKNTDGPNWNDNSGWLEYETACSWYGITCEKGNVVRLELSADWGDSFGLVGDIPAEIGNLAQLDVLNLSWNDLNTVPREIGQLFNLGALHLTGNQITALPQEIEQLSRLGWLFIGINPLNTIPAEIGQLTKLRELDLRQSQLITLPTEIGDLATLEQLNLNDNNLNNLPMEIGNLFRLTDLNLRENQLNTLPSGISRLSRLNELDLSGNKFDKWPAKINNLTNLTSLSFSNSSLKTLPPEISNLSSLSELDLSGNEFDEWPAEINSLVNLTSLSFENNHLQTVPPEIVRLSNLKELHLSRNALSTLSAEIGDLVYLEKLDISKNQLPSLPAEIGNLINLDHLCPNDNRLSTLPTTFVKLINVQDLKLEDNQLEVTDEALLEWMNAKDPDWAARQTP